MFPSCFDIVFILFILCWYFLHFSSLSKVMLRSYPNGTSSAQSCQDSRSCRVGFIQKNCIGHWSIIFHLKVVRCLFRAYQIHTNQTFGDWKVKPIIIGQTRASGSPNSCSLLLQPSWKSAFCDFCPGFYAQAINLWSSLSRGPLETPWLARRLHPFLPPRKQHSELAVPYHAFSFPKFSKYQKLWFSDSPSNWRIDSSTEYADMSN